MSEDRKSSYPARVRKHVALNHGCRSASAARNGGDYLPRQNIQESTVHDLVYRYLHKIADRDSKWRQRSSACDKFQRRHARRKDIHERPVTRITTDLGEDIGADSERFRSRVRKGTLPETLRMPRNSSQEYVADYTRAVRDGRRRATFYVRNALLYGLQFGLLAPTARRGDVLRISQELRIFPLKNPGEDEEN